MRTSTDRAIHEASARLERSLATHETLRKQIAGTLPIAAAERHMDDIEDHLEAIRAKLRAALALHETEIERMEAAAVDRDFARWDASVRAA